MAYINVAESLTYFLQSFCPPPRFWGFDASPPRIKIITGKEEVSLLEKTWPDFRGQAPGLVRLFLFYA
jgi:hypothetical protein